MEKLMLELKKIELQKSEIEKKFLKEHSIKDNLNNTNEILETSVDVRYKLSMVVLNFFCIFYLDYDTAKTSDDRKTKPNGTTNNRTATSKYSFAQRN